ncbi:fatty acyl-AMP ligase [Burkholderia ubonensis]|uniref:fatty acyl-AMP ligase n=1 Tax=Burkholderia ubonensis TaxID=101571 RepID=UPI0007581D75|nr:fatty acyl-AMP ligase [Burkholderia ubonensis]KWN79892.1 hypothetical protein WM23_22335 [Burkholderia ubonensis]
METIVDIFLDHAANRPDKPAFIMLGDKCVELIRLTYAELDRRARSIAYRLARQHPVGARVLMLYPSNVDFAIAFLACQYAGLVAVPVPLPTKLGVHLQRIEHIVSDAGVSVVLTMGKLIGEMTEWLQSPTMREIDCVDSDALDIDDALLWSLPILTDENIAFLQYTSGSTGSPKGVMVSHANLVHNSSLQHRRFLHSPDTPIGGWLPFYHDMGLIGLLLQAFYAGTSLVYMQPISFIRRPINWLKAISHYRIHTSGGPDFGFRHCVSRICDDELKDIDLSSWTICFSGAERVRQETITRFHQRFAQCKLAATAAYPCYGMAEATLFVSGKQPMAPHRTLWVDRGSLSADRIFIRHACDPNATEIVSCGNVIGHEAAIVDPDTRLALPTNHIGEIWIRGRSVARGYWNDDIRSQATFGAVLEGYGTSPFLRTGDLGFMNNGELFVTGRLKDLIVVNGRKIYPEDIEDLIAQIDTNFQQVFGAAFSIDGKEGEALTIVQEVQRSEVGEMQFSECAMAIRAEISANFGVPVSRIVFVRNGSIPRTTSGKVQRSKTKFLLINGQLSYLHDDVVIGQNGEAH